MRIVRSGEAPPAEALESAMLVSVRDTAPTADARYHELLRSLAPHERLERAMALTRSVRALAEAGIRSRHPHADGAEVRARLAVRLYGRDVAQRLFDDVPEDAT